MNEHERHAITQYATIRYRVQPDQIENHDIDVIKGLIDNNPTGEIAFAVRQTVRLLEAESLLKEANSEAATKKGFSWIDWSDKVFAFLYPDADTPQ